MKLDDNVRFIKGVGEKRAELFKQLGVVNVDTLLHLYPRDYEDRSHPLILREAPFDRKCCIKATVISEIKEIITNHRMVIYKFIISDGDETAEVTLFNTKYTAEKIKIGSTYLFYGFVERNLFGSKMSSPKIYDEIEDVIMPIYPQTAGLNTKIISKAVFEALKSTDITDSLPAELINKYGLCSLQDALMYIHFPKTNKEIEIARKRLCFEELFYLQAGILFQKSTRSKSTDITITDKYLIEFLKLLPFNLTEAQQNAINDCLYDLGSKKPMSRLIQGDVGSGKTAVAAALAYITAKEGYQVVIMAPTEVLASQHYKTFSSLFNNSNVSVALLTGSVTKSNKNKLKSSLSNGDIDIIIGTHAVLEDDVHFNKLGLVITDEQHRFGVEQRTKLSNKGNNPHMLVMSATPIPRTMSLIFYGDLDISIIDTLPNGRQPIETYLIDEDVRERAYAYIKKHLDEGRQGYIVCPAVEENEQTNLASAVKYFEKLSKEDFSNYSVALLHGKMKPKEKDAVMKDFSDGKTQLLISTTVIEVGVDVPNAVIMMIENAERFGLSQLHQLRGRIGRGKHKSTCILVSEKAGSDGSKRLKFLTSTIDGFKIADEDLRLRGPGDFLGKRQHGLPELKIADLSKDMEIFRAAGQAASSIHKTDPDLIMDENKYIKKEIQRMFGKVNLYGYN